MKKTFNLMKALKVGLSSLALAGSCLMADTASAQYFSTRGTQIIDPAGNPVFFNGTNLGNWLVWEGYMMMGDFNYRTHGQFWEGVKNALGGDAAKASEFERKWRENYVTQKTIDELKGLGYNSVRVPFNYRLFWDINTNQPSNEGFTYINNLISYCRGKGMYILLDMHGAPGFQNPGDHSDNYLSNASHPMWTVGFLDGTSDNGTIGANVAKTAQVWRHIANYYKNEPIIWGYDIVNEPQTDKSDALWTAYKHIISTIRQVDNNHIVVVEGDNWGGYMDMFTNWGRPKLDPKVVLQTHHYINSNWNAIGELNGRKTIANNLNAPIMLGEFGEDEGYILREISRVAKAAQYSGIFAWSFKKVSHDRSLWTVRPDANSADGRAFLNLRKAINTNTSLAAASGGQSTYTDLLNFATYAVRNGDSRLAWSQTFYEDTSNPVNNTPIPGISGTYAIISKSSGKALEVKGGWNYNGAPIQQWSFVGLAHQKWNITPLGGDTYKITDVNSSKALDLAGGNTADGAGLQIWDDVNGVNQKWKIEFNASRNAYTIKSTVTKPNGVFNAIDVPNGSTLDGLALQVWTFYSNSVNQEWELRKQ